MASIVLTVSDEKLLTQLKRACMMLKGVTAVTVRKREEKPLDVTQTAGYREAMEDVERGRVTKYSSLEDFFQEMELNAGIHQSCQITL